MKNITIIGTSHIAKESICAVKNFIKNNKPEIVAVELDKNRFLALVQKKTEKRINFKDIRRIGVTGFIFAVFGSWASNKLGKMVGSKPGDEMIAAIKEAKKIDAKVVLIDQNIEITLMRFSKFVTLKEKLRFVEDILRALFFTKKELKKLGLKEKLDLKKVPSKELIHKLIKRLKQRYPNVYQVLINERDMHMSKALTHIKKENPENKILAVVGAGHEEGMTKYLKKLI